MRSDRSNASGDYHQLAADLVIQLGELPDREEVLCRCPLCGDSATDITKKRFAVNLIKGKYHCFNCLRSGGKEEITSLLMKIHLGKMKLPEQTTIDLANLRRKDFKLQGRLVPVSHTSVLIQKQILSDLLPRKVFTEKEILKLQYALPGTRPKKWVGRVVIELDGVKFAKAINRDIKPKYLTEPGFKLAEHGYLNARNVNCDPGILTEGLLDVLSLPENSAMMSPGTSGMFNDMLFDEAKRRLIISVPDSDVAGARCFLKVLNKGIPNGVQLKFCFAYWVTDTIGEDINDLLVKHNFTPRLIYDNIVRRALPAELTLSKLKERFNIIKTDKGYIIPDTGKNDTQERNNGRADIDASWLSKDGSNTRRKDTGSNRAGGGKKKGFKRNDGDSGSGIKWF